MWPVLSLQFNCGVLSNHAAGGVELICDESVRKRVSAHENLKKTGLNGQFEVQKILYVVTVSYISEKV
jgi:hypothetical protein